MSDTILIVGRGQSAHDFDWSQVDVPVMAVSSGIFAIPRSVKVDHFVSLDEPKYYMAQLMEHAPNAWCNDPSAQYWPFWADAGIVKHVPTSKMHTIKNLILPVREIIQAIDVWAKCTKASNYKRRRVKDAFYATMGDQYCQFGLQPGWGDYQNVRGWTFKRAAKPQWTGDGPLSIPKVFNTIYMAVQVATRLRYTKLCFIGVDLDDELYASIVVLMKRWYRHACKAGIEWINLAPKSKLSDFVPSPAEPPSAMDLADIGSQYFGDRPLQYVPVEQDGFIGFDIMPVEEAVAV